MNEVSITVFYNDNYYYSDPIICDDSEVDNHAKELKKILDNPDEPYITFKRGIHEYFFTRGIIENSILTITAKKIGKRLQNSNRRSGVNKEAT